MKEVEFGDVEATELRVKPNLPVLGPKLGKELGRGARGARGGRVRAARRRRLPRRRATSSRPTRCSSSASGARAGPSPREDGLTVALDTALDPELELEGRVLDLIHQLNAMRKDAGLELTDRIVRHAAGDRVRPPRARRLDQGRGAGGRDPRRRRQRRARDRQGVKRCAWVPEGDPEYVAYHDEEWGLPSRDDRHLFELLTLEGAQAGLSWSTILRKRPGYRKAFANFDAAKVARFSKRDVERLLADPSIVRNRLKVESTVNNAQRILELDSLTTTSGASSAASHSSTGGRRSARFRPRPPSRRS